MYDVYLFFLPSACLTCHSYLTYMLLLVFENLKLVGSRILVSNCGYFRGLWADHTWTMTVDLSGKLSEWSMPEKRRVIYEQSSCRHVESWVRPRLTGKRCCCSNFRMADDESEDDVDTDDSSKNVLLGKRRAATEERLTQSSRLAQ